MRPAPPPYGIALGVFGVVLAGYVATLAPSVTFWDAGELIASAKTLGIPHPPGTPLFVLLAHVWARLLPIGEYAWRTNLLSAAFSAAGAGFWFLSAHAVLGALAPDLAPGRARRVRTGGAIAAALIPAFTFTQWQNSNETEVYGVATFTIAAIVWLGLRWRAHRGTPEASRRLLLAVYLGGLSMGNHLLALLVGPALVGFLAVELRANPAGDPAARRREWGEVGVVAGIWTLLIGVGLGHTALSTLGALAFGTAAGIAWSRGGKEGARFAALTAGLALVGASSYLFLYLRARQGPVINEADPSTWDALLAVIRRAQYPLRTPLDDPTQLHGPDNPGRSLTLLGLQLLNYLQYFDWQWAKALPGTVGGALTALPNRTLLSLAFLSLGLRGLWAHRRADRSSWWLVLLLFLVTGPGLVAYMNFKPGFSLAYDRFPNPEHHEVRERDYFFVASFIAWGFWAGLGLATLVRDGLGRWRGRLAGVAWAGFALAAVPLVLNLREASRRQTPDARLAGDFAYSLLNSVPPYGVLFTYGDNDTFPLWWAQEVAGVRRDVSVVCLALAETPWYMRQLRDNPARDFERPTAPAFWRSGAAPKPTWPLHTMSDREIAAAVPQALPEDVRLRFGAVEVTLPRGTVLYSRDFVAIRILQQNFGRRPVAWAMTATGAAYGLDRHLVQQGMAVRVLPTPPDTASGRYDLRRVMGAPLDLATTDSLALGVYRYGDLLRSGTRGLESTARDMAATLGMPLLQLATAADERGDDRAILRYVPTALRLNASPALEAALEAARRRAASNRP